MLHLNDTVRSCVSRVCYTGDKDADDRRGAVCVLLASTADLQPALRDLSSNQHVSS